MERLDFSSDTKYNSIEAAIHLNRYGLAKPYCAGARVLDAACGEGYGSYLMKSWGAKSVDGIDIDQASIDQARALFKDDGLTYTQGAAEHLPYESNSFDLVVSLETMEHVDDVDAFLSEIKRVLKPGGTVILSCPNDNYYFEKDNIENPFHKRPYTFFEFKELAEKHLGTYVDYFLAFALDGFINLPFERRTEPERSTGEDALGMLHYTHCDQALCVPQERYLNQWNANYYVGIWGRLERANRYSVTIAPREFFVDHTDKDYDLLHHLDDVRAELSRLQEAVEERDRQLEQAAAQHRDELEQAAAQHRDELEQVKAKCGSELEWIKAQYEKDLQQLRQDQIQEYETRLQRMKETGETKEMEMGRLRVLLELTKRERDEAQGHMNVSWAGCQQAAQEAQHWESEYRQAAQQARYWEDTCQQALARVQSMESSRGVRLLAKLYNLRQKIKRLFHR